jgi:hypothetical protein
MHHIDPSKQDVEQVRIYCLSSLFANLWNHQNFLIIIEGDVNINLLKPSGNFTYDQV